MPRIVVFLGPSMPHDEARSILDADYRPPARRGDVLAAARDGADIICLIDGVFFQDSSVAHKEILEALQMGVKVIGASSMGALRAAEMDVYGMEGVGEIYRAYRSGEIVADDEVALVFDPVTLAPLSEPLVNIRHNLRLAVDEGFIDENSAADLLDIARARYFPSRSYENLMNDAAGRVPEETLLRFRRFLDTRRADLKREDAIRALRRAAEVARELTSSSCSSS
ncbi:MAG TPA: TfuA-related McrA-glycine thioamidation protein [Methanothrix sp.]|nr:TfuA-related McrA-glycine thioamidation protein [Methanothrix sp.]HOK57809.1 TfuA-related McrA-glycine thioamidation protein [Methanothrix sp.]HOL43197.1 TfuA-related McrA-glycine thioamidation protein [Methanothrix sp.]HPO88297.1 TfuA-related McrA-glycine thioamidation protein [Methanothrix sp.]